MRSLANDIATLFTLSKRKSLTQNDQHSLDRLVLLSHLCGSANALLLTLWYGLHSEPQATWLSHTTLLILSVISLGLLTLSLLILMYVRYLSHHPAKSLQQGEQDLL